MITKTMDINVDDQVYADDFDVDDVDDDDDDDDTDQLSHTVNASLQTH